MIAEHIRDGKIVPMHVTISLLRNAIEANLKKYDNASRPGWGHGHGRFLIDGFPRKMDQAIEFEESVCSAQFVLFLHCTEEMMLKRLLHRGETSGRIDDNAESIKKRFRTFEETSMPVVDAFRKVGKVAEVDSMRDVDNVYAEIEKVMEAKLIQH
ncbi:hypothetical protein MVES_001469 [Malassezia vespertilionis]|uniref:Uncharacterized protein n=2 Tax=Malassezia vespertilionis TaxID=2020962 RepID=A0A2N1JD83_9BASI|nr:hypothetical protein MVES_001469 [Malassezia vespertilionis]